jgi:hypothetical protein
LDVNAGILVVPGTPKTFLPLLQPCLVTALSPQSVCQIPSIDDLVEFESVLFQSLLIKSVLQDFVLRVGGIFLTVSSF